MKIQISLSAQGLGVEKLRPFMDRAGYVFLGSGLEGSAWGKDKHVLKIMRKQTAAPYLAFVNYARKHPNKHFPKFEAINTDIKFSGMNLVSVKMERLDENRLSNYTALSIFINAAIKAGDAVKGYPYYRTERNIMLNTKQSLLSKTAKKYSSLILVIADLISVGNASSSIKFDFANSSNMMMRGNTLVVMDPFY